MKCFGMCKIHIAYKYKFKNKYHRAYFVLKSESLELNRPVRPKARGLGRTGVFPSLARDVTVMERSLPTALAETAQLLASGNSSCCSKYIQPTATTKISHYKPG